MSDHIQALVARIHALEEELEDELEKRRDALILRIDNGRVIFDREVEARQDALRTALRKYIGGARPLIVLTAPVIYAVIIPFVLLDLFVTLYQAVCFPVYGLTKVRRQDHIVFDRHRLRYLNAVEKLNCVYCAYGNGLLSYATEIAALTESYWCPIKHARRMHYVHRHYHDFAEFGDAVAYKDRVDRWASHRRDAAR